MGARTSSNKWLTLLVFLLVFTGRGPFAFNVLEHAVGSTFYVSVNGSDLYLGTETEPFRTIQRAADIMQPGDTCYIRSGTFRETVRPVHSGSARAPISFVAYPGEKPVVSGADVLDVSWIVHSGEIYKAATPKEFIQLFIDGQMMNEARWPNTAVDDLVHMKRATCDWGTNDTTLVDDALPPGDWNDAYVHITPTWYSIMRQIKDYQGGDRFDFADSVWEIPRAGNPYWLFGALAGLDVAGEWFLYSTADTVYVWCPGDPNPWVHTIEIKQRDYAFDLSDLAYIHVEGFEIFGAGISMNGSAYCIVDDCHVKYHEHFRLLWGGQGGINLMSGFHNEWRNSSIAYSAGYGILDVGMFNKVTNCIIHDVDYMALDLAAIYSEGYGAEYTQNTIYSSGGSVMKLQPQGQRVERNDISNGSLLIFDQANIDVGVQFNPSVITIVAYNRIYDNYGGGGWGHGIWLWQSNLLVHHNLIYNIAGDAISMDMPSLNSEFYNNTILSSCLNAFRTNTMPGQIPDQTGTKVINNLAKAPMEFVMGSRAPEHHHNGDYAVYDPNGWPTPFSGAIDAGVVIPGITDSYVGAAPDIGCFEVGTEGWQAGADWVDSFVEDFETADFSSFPWEHYGDTSWNITSLEKYSGTYSAKAGPIDPGESSVLHVSLDCVSGHISFYRKVSSSQDSGFLTFYSDGIEQDKWSGEQDWEKQSFYITSGERTFEWVYSKDRSVPVGADSAWIDEIVLPIERKTE